MFSNNIENPKVVILFIVCNLVWFFFTAYLIVSGLKRERKAERMISRLSDSNSFLADELNDVREDYMKYYRKYQELQLAINLSISKINKEVQEIKDEIH